MNTKTKKSSTFEELSMHNIGIIVNCLQGGGAERCAADLSVYFSDQGYNVIIFTDLSFSREYEYKGILVDFTYHLDISEKSNPLEEKIDELRKLKEQNNIDISISFMQFANYINVLSKGREKVILTTHSVNSIYAKMENDVFWSEHTFQKLYQYADVITFPSEYCRNDWIEHYGDKNNITRTIYNPVHLMNTDKNTEKENLIIAIGRMHSIKRQWHLIEAFKKVQEVYPEYKLIILGNGELKSRLESLVAELGLQSKVDMPGNVSNITQYLNKAKIMIMSSYCEAMPCSILEALSAGVPVISCDSPGGIREELGVDLNKECSDKPLQGECGIITPFIKENNMQGGSKEESIFAEEIIHLIKNENLRKKMSDRARMVVNKFSIERIGKRWIEEIFIDTPLRQYDLENFQEDKRKSLDSFNLKRQTPVDMYVSYYRLLEKWMILHEKEIKISSFFEQNKLYNIIIYGMGKMAAHLVYDLKNSNINIVCAIDKKAINKYGDFPIISGTDEIPYADCIVVTPVYEFEKIKNQMKKKVTIPLISLSDIIDQIL